MLLINTETITIHEFFGSQIPPYVILSHTWGDEEVTLAEMLHGGGKVSSKAGYSKILKCCEQARRDDFEWAWVDTCCINKTSSAELSEAVNSMYAWYERAQICYVHLSDTCGRLYTDESESQCSRWFTRGWTLQELLAPRHVEFYDRDWNKLGTKVGLSRRLSEITGINSACLLGTNPRYFFVSERMSWAAGRETTREEDRAYSLLGLFDINMPLIYGEGAKAFHRLQKKIMKSSDDRTILAWSGQKLEREDHGLIITGLLASSPDDFAESKGYRTVRSPDSSSLYDWPPIITEGSVTFNLPVVTLPYSKKANMILVDIGCKTQRDDDIYIRLLGDDGLWRMGPLLILLEGFREENAMAKRTIAARRYSLEGPQRDPLQFHFSGVDVIEALPSSLVPDVELMFFKPQNSNDSDESMIDQSQQLEGNLALTYCDEHTFSAATVPQLREPHHQRIVGSFSLNPSKDWTPEISPDSPEDRVAYTTFGMVLQTQGQTLCRIAIGALHEPITRPWCIIDEVDPTLSDDEWFEHIVREWDAETNTPDYAMLSVIDADNQHYYQVEVNLKKRAPAGKDEPPSYTVHVSLKQNTADEEELAMLQSLSISGSERFGSLQVSEKPARDHQLDE